MLREGRGGKSRCLCNQRPAGEKQHGSTREPGPKKSQFQMHGAEDKAERFSVNGKNREREEGRGRH